MAPVCTNNPHRLPNVQGCHDLNLKPNHFPSRCLHPHLCQALRGRGGVGAGGWLERGGTSGMLPGSYQFLPPWGLDPVSATKFLILGNYKNQKYEAWAPATIFMMFPPVLKRSPKCLPKQNLCERGIPGKWFLFNGQSKGSCFYYPASIGSASNSAAWPRISGSACLASDMKSGSGRCFLSPWAQRASGPKHSQI